MQIICFLIIALCVGLIIFAGNQILNGMSPLFYTLILILNIYNVMLWINILRDVA